MNELRSIDLTSGVNERGEGFVTVSVSTDERELAIGQLSPVEVRLMALSWLEAAEAAEQDAAVLRCVRKLGLQDQLAAMVITELRASREP